MANQISAIDEINKAIDRLEENLFGVDKRILDISKHIREASKGFHDAKIPSDVVKKIKESATYTEQLNAERKEQDRLEKALIRQLAKKELVLESTNRALVKQRVETQLSNKLIKEEAVLSSSLADAYDKLRVKRNRAARELKNLIADERSSNTAIRAKQKELDKLNRKYVKANRASKDFRDQVGNYPSAFGKAQLALRTFAGAFGAFTALRIAKDIFDNVKELNALDAALKKVTGTTNAYNRVNSFLLDRAKAYGIEIKSLTKEYTRFLAGLKGTNLEGEKGKKIFDKVIKTSAALGNSQEETNGILNAFTQIISKGTVQAEELRGQLGDRLPGAFNIMARAIGVSVEELNKMLQNGEVIADDVLPKFADELEKTFGLQNTKKINTVVAAQNRLKNVWTNFLRDVEGGEGVLSKAFIGILNTGSKLLELFGKLVRDNKTYIETIREEQIQLNGLVNRITDTNISNEERARLMDNLRTNYPSFLKFLGKEQETNENLSSTLKEVNELYIKRIALQSQQDKIQKILEKSGERALTNARSKISIDRELADINEKVLKGSIDLTNKSFEERVDLIKNELQLRAQSERQGSRLVRNEEKEILDALNASLTSYNGGLGNTTNLTKDLNQEQKLLKEIEKELGITLEEINNLFNVNTKEKINNSKSTIDSTKTNKDANIVIENSIGYFQQLKKVLQDRIPYQTTTEGLNEIKQALEDIDEAISELENGTDLNFDAFDDLFEADELKEAAESVQKQINSSISDGINNLAQDLGIPVNELFAEFKGLYEWDYNNFLEFSKKKIDQAELEEERKRELLFEGIETASTFISTTGDLFNSMFQRRISQYDDDIERNRDYYATLLDNENLTEEQRSALEAERERKEREIEKKKRQQQKKQAQINKAVNAAEIIANTAVAVSKALAQGGFVLGIPQAAVVAALGAVQLATVLAQPIPQFRKGKDKSNNYEGLAIWGEERQEVKVSKDGQIEVSPKKAGNYLTQVKKDDIIYPSVDKYVNSIPTEKLIEDVEKYSILASLQSQNQALDAYLMAKEINGGLKQQTKELSGVITKAFKDNRPRVNMFNNFDITDKILFNQNANDILP